MGLSISSAKFLTKAWKDGACFKNTLTLGRQHMLIKPERARAILKQYGAWPPPQGESAFLQAVGTEFPWAFNTFARALGAEKTSACDASSYEGADYTHDLNLPVPSELEETFDLVIDGGTLEHVFNFPTAMANCMKMVKTGGHLIIFTPINNYCGHGFYQFSPELFYRVLSPENGFEVARMVAVADDVGIGSFFGLRYYFPITGPWYEVMDPAKIGKRVTLMNQESVILMVLARKTANTPIFHTFPQQSDYVPRWQSNKGDNLPKKPKRKRPLIDWLGNWFAESFYSELRTRLALLLNPRRLNRFRRKNSFRNETFYRRLDD